MTADELWGLGMWTRAFAARTLGFEAPRVPTHFRRPTDWDRALHFLGRQYGPLVTKRAAEVGSDAVVRELLSALGVGS